MEPQCNPDRARCRIVEPGRREAGRGRDSASLLGTRSADTIPDAPPRRWATGWGHMAATDTSTPMDWEESPLKQWLKKIFGISR
jgi:hypothetical protein